MNITILGSGAMGCIYGGFLAESGENQVTLVDIWKEHMDAINQNGLVIMTPDGRERVVKNLKGVYSAAEAGPTELIIVFVKATHTEEAMRQATNLADPETMVLTLQNGLGNVEKLCNVVPRKQVIAGTTAFGASIKGPGRIHQGGAGDTVIGELDGALTGRIEKIKGVLDRANLSGKVADNVLGLIWSKLSVNVGINAIASLCNIRNGQILDYPESAALQEAAVKECVAVAQAKGIRFPDADPLAHVREVTLKTGQNTCSMLQDVLAKRQTEIAVINGAVVAAGQETGLATPVNWVLTNLIKTIQSSYPQA
ncbi:MAG: 2-dehydropantoate 2-reductase [Candidatus Adiutrix sp.]|jgi:2-dehydropantoate 2-reductase|nr:2-dehydropantoate 2-reductase [Candidatus Adiutrix sp.]